MPWGRTSDDAYTYPMLLAVAGIPGAPDYAVNEVFGFFQACILQSAGHVTDYVINKGAVQTAGRARWRKVLAWSERVGLLTPVEIDGMEHWVLHNDPKFIHIRTKAELDAEDRKRDAAKKPHLTIAVRLRDGDNCRYCGIYVIWDGRRSLRSGELDHRDPTEYANAPDDLVVACRSCNGSRQNNTNDWDTRTPLLPVPAHPNYGEPTASWLSNNGCPTEPNVDHDVLRARGKASSSKPAAATTAARPAAQEPQQHEQPARRAPSPETTPRTSPKPPHNDPIDADTRSIETSSAGSGRDGSGPGLAPGPGQAPGQGRGPSRRRRGGRGRGRAREAPASPDQHDPKPDPPDLKGPSMTCCAKPYPGSDNGERLCLTCGVPS